MKICLIICSIFILASCSSPTHKQKVKEVVVKQSKVTEKTQTVDNLLFLAKESHGDDAINYLFKAASLAFETQQYKQTIWLSKQLLPLLTNKKDEYQLHIYLSISCIAENLIEIANHHLTQAVALAKDNNIKHNFHYWSAKEKLTNISGLSVQNNNAKLQMFAQAQQYNVDEIIKIWQSLSKLNSWQLEQLDSLSPPYGKGWLSLQNVFTRHIVNSNVFKRELNQWTKRYPTHPANAIVDQLTSSTFIASSETINHIAVLLPLSGKHKRSGNVAQQGILAAYNNNSEIKLTFIDSTKVDYSDLATHLRELQVNAMIGPLLKQNVDTVINLPEITLPTLLLNIPSKFPLAANFSAISMRPEDEAMQAASILANNNYLHPLVLSHDDPLSNRISKSFIKQWSKITGNEPEKLVFKRDKNMQANLKKSLGVDQSESRIKDLTNRVKQRIKTVERSRRDIDMVYLIGKPIESRLIKPYIDVNTSPFADLIPVYSSSRSHSDKTDSNENRDLIGLTFTEMPWLLESKQRNKALYSMSKQLWPTRSDGLQRIFAMAYDSYALIFKTPQMALTPVLKHQGQTGTLQRQENGIVTRSLLWGRYKRNKVEEIAMEQVVKQPKG